MAVTVVLDTNVFLNVKNREEPYYESSKRVLDAADDGRVHAVVSVVSIAELCAGYYLAGDERGRQELIIHLQSSKGFSVVELSVKLADAAEESGLKLGSGCPTPS